MFNENDTFFIADCHLEGSRPLITELFMQFIKHIEGAGQLWILGDFVEYWIGDDAGNPELNPVFDAVRALSAAGTRIDFMLGNRDFLLGEAFAQQVGATVHTEDEQLITLPNKDKALLLHGDTLCTDDVEYLKLRQMLRSEEWQTKALSQSVQERIATAQSFRNTSKEATAGKAQTIMDVNAATVADAFTRAQVNTIIHGHTHRPKHHHTSADQEDVRVVVGDWHDDHAMVAHANLEGLRLMRFPFST